MKKESINAFISVVRHYFDSFGKDGLVLDTPYLLEDKNPTVYDYTGVIEVSGVMNGVVYVTTTTELLKVLLGDMQENDDSESMLIDLVGEIANTIAGNARTYFGSNFNISTPFVFQGNPKTVFLSKQGRAFVVPILWQSQIGQIVVSFDEIDFVVEEIEGRSVVGYGWIK